MMLEGKRILVVEDEYMIAVDLKRALIEAGAEVVGPTGDLGKGLALAGAGGLDAAVLDLNLEGAWTFPIADRLESDGVPYLFVTGYDAWAMPSGYADKPAMPKPYHVAAVTAKVASLCGAGAR